jgi:hypothetical protein
MAIGVDWTAASNGPILHPRAIYEYGKSRWMLLTGGNRRTRRKIYRVPLCLPQIPYGLTRSWTQASAVRGRRLTARTIARPGRIFISKREEVTGDRDNYIIWSFLVCILNNIFLGRWNEERCDRLGMWHAWERWSTRTNMLLEILDRTNHWET